MGKSRSKFASVIHRWRHGLVLEAIRQRLASIGIVIEPYYWIQEGLDGSAASELDGVQEGYCLKFFDLDEIKSIASIKEVECCEEELLGRIGAGQRCFGAIVGDQIAAFMWVDLERCNWKHHEFELHSDEAYLYNMFTVGPFRGRGLAPYLRYQCYKHLAQLGRDKLYSYSDLFNTPSIRFKKKLNARFLRRGLHVELFGRYRWSFGGIGRNDAQAAESRASCVDPRPA